MISPTQFHVFLSAVSSEFKQERMQLENWLERKGLHVSSQEKFNQGGSTLWQKLHDEAARCQAVICVMGAEPGWPSLSTIWRHCSRRRIGRRKRSRRCAGRSIFFSCSLV
jgi:Domain of unknown function (DUF4062)